MFLFVRAFFPIFSIFFAILKFNKLVGKYLGALKSFGSIRRGKNLNVTFMKCDTDYCKKAPVVFVIVDDDDDDGDVGEQLNILKMLMRRQTLLHLQNEILIMSLSF